MNLRDIYPDKKFLKVVHFTKRCPLRFEDRLVYSELVYLSAKGLRKSGRWIAARLCLDKDTVFRSLKRLAAVDLIDATGTAKKPGPDQVGWFSFLRKSARGEWQHRFSYTPLPLPKKLPKRMSWRNLFVYFWLVSETSDDEDDLRRPRAAAEIARVLRLSAPTVRVVLEELLAEEIIALDGDGRVARCFLPHEKWIDDTFVDKPTKPTASPVEKFEEMTEGAKFAYVEGGTSSGRVYRHLKAYGGFTAHQIKYILQASSRMWHELESILDDNALMEIFKLAKTDHAKNQETGKYQNEPTCWKLFKHMFDKHCQNKGLSISA
jgi:hypothetical protein